MNRHARNGLMRRMFLESSAKSGSTFMVAMVKDGICEFLMKDYQGYFSSHADRAAHFEKSELKNALRCKQVKWAKENGYEIKIVKETITFELEAA